MHDAKASAHHSFGKVWPGLPVEPPLQPAPVTELLAALDRIHEEAGHLAERAYKAIQAHAFDPYREFCEKRTEYQALLSVLRGRIGGKDAAGQRSVDERERGLLSLSIKACVKFVFALSAVPVLPIGVLETFLSELEMLRAARAELEPEKEQPGVSELLDEVEMALMILEEISGRAAALESF